MSRTIGADTACMAKPGNTDALTKPGRHDPPAQALPLFQR
jgi:hypothetical protein